uniref:Uncharacterized protein n=1 Tax=Bionectria ochroleuca TaxID=29856 RepID=A0A8H7N7T6_BIOOC
MVGQGRIIRSLPIPRFRHVSSRIIYDGKSIITAPVWPFPGFKKKLIKYEGDSGRVPAINMYVLFLTIHQIKCRWKIGRSAIKNLGFNSGAAEAYITQRADLRCPCMLVPGLAEANLDRSGK